MYRRGQNGDHPRVSVIGFRVDNHPVIALLFDGTIKPKGSLVSFKLKLPNQPERVSLISDLGMRIPLKGKYRKGRLSLKISRAEVMRMNETGKTTIAYLVVREGNGRKKGE